MVLQTCWTGKVFLALLKCWARLWGYQQAGHRQWLACLPVKHVAGPAAEGLVLVEMLTELQYQ
eukprot:10456582-Prorocentrum_lima.AAC.1